MNQSIGRIGHFWVPPGLCFKTRVGVKPLIWKWFFILIQIKLIFTRKVVHLISFWKWGFLELGSGLLMKLYMIRNKTCRCKIREFWGPSAEIRGKNLSWDFEVIYIFSKNGVLNMCRYLKNILYLQENKQHFLKVPLFFIKDAKNHRNRLNCSSWKTRLTSITRL